LTTHEPTITPKRSNLPSHLISAISNCVVILVASIPIAIEIVCTSTLAVGSRRLAESKVIVARLSAIEELAGMTILCSDKTGACDTHMHTATRTVLHRALRVHSGERSSAPSSVTHWQSPLLLSTPMRWPGTLTQNKLSLNEPILIAGGSAAELNFHAALASKRDGSQDAIDFCICNAVTPEDKSVQGGVGWGYVPLRGVQGGSGDHSGPLASAVRPTECARYPPPPHSHYVYLLDSW
jgi:hypothetical protein